MMVVMMTIGQQPPLAEHGKLGFEPAVKEKGNDELIITFTHYSKITFLSIFVEFMTYESDNDFWYEKPPKITF